jgi:magnesium transporter
MRFCGTSSASNLARCARYQSQSLPTPPSSPSRQRTMHHNTLFLRARHFHLASFKNIFRQKDVESSGMSDTQEEVAKAAILEKVMKGRQLTDLMLRCTFLLHSIICCCAHSGTGTILDHAGTLSIFSSLSSRFMNMHVHLGNIKSISGQFKRSDLCNEHRLNVSSLRSD